VRLNDNARLFLPRGTLNLNTFNTYICVYVHIYAYSHTYTNTYMSIFPDVFPPSFEGATERQRAVAPAARRHAKRRGAAGVVWL